MRVLVLRNAQGDPREENRQPKGGGVAVASNQPSRGTARNRVCLTPGYVRSALTGRCPLLGAQNTDSQKEGA